MPNHDLSPRRADEGPWGYYYRCTAFQPEQGYIWPARNPRFHYTYDGMTKTITDLKTGERSRAFRLYYEQNEAEAWEREQEGKLAGAA